MRGHFWLNLFLVMVGVVVGSMAAEMTVGIPWLKWLSYGLEFGTESPVVLDLNLLRLTFGISIRITVSMILFIAVALLLGRVITREN